MSLNKNILQKKTVVFYLIGAILAVTPILGSLFRGGVGNDSAYYICHAQLVAHGMTPYLDFCFGYTPLWLYIAAALKIMFHIPDGNYVFYLILHYLFLVGNAFFLYKISRKWNASRDVALFNAFLYMIMSQWIEGNSVLLEIPSIFFGLWACYVLLINQGKQWIRFVVPGIICSCSFLCKQYGLGFVALGIFIIIAINKGSWKEVAAFLLGYSILIVFSLLYWGDKFISILFSGYGTTSAIEAGLNFTLWDRILSILKSVGFFSFFACPMILFPLLGIPLSYRRNFDMLWKIVFCYCGVIGFGLQFYFESYYHYFLYIEPFGILIMTVILSIADKTWLQKLKWLLVIWTLLFSLYNTYYCTVYQKYISHNQRKHQYAIAEEINSIIPPNTCLFAAGDLQFIYLLTRTVPPNLKTIGFSFGALGINASKSLKQAMDAPYVVMDSSRDFQYSWVVMDCLVNCSYCPIYNGALLIYTKNPTSERP